MKKPAKKVAKPKRPESHPSDVAFEEWRSMLKDTPPKWSDHRDVLRFAFRAGWDRGLYEWRTR